MGISCGVGRMRIVFLDLVCRERRVSDALCSGRSGSSWHLPEKPPDRPGLIMAKFRESIIQRSIMPDRISVGVQEGRIPVPEGAVASLAIIREPDIPAPQVYSCVVTSQNNKWIFGTSGVMRFASVRKIEDHCVVEHRSTRFGHTLETCYHPVDQAHVMSAAPLPDDFRGQASNGLVVTHIVHVQLHALQPRERCPSSSTVNAATLVRPEISAPSSTSVWPI